MGKTGKPFCHEHSGTMRDAPAAMLRAATAAMDWAATAVCAAFAILLVILVSAATTSTEGGTAAAATTAAKGACGLVIDVSHPTAGVTINASGIGAVQAFSAYLGPQLLATFRSDASGHLAGRLDLPPDTHGPQTLRVGSASCSSTITFDAGPPNGPPPPPPPPISAPPPVQVGLSNDLRYGLITLVVTTAVLMLLLTSRLGRRTSPHN